MCVEFQSDRCKGFKVDIFRISPIVFKLEYALFYQFNAEITTFSIKKCSVRLLSTTS